MMKTLPDMNELAALVVAVADEVIMPASAGVQCTTKADGSPVTPVDLAVQERIRHELSSRWPAIGFLSEEMSHAEQQAAMDSEEFYWCLDPLDGTTNFVAGVPLFAVSLALLSAAGSVLGVIYDPVRKELFSARRGHGASFNGQALHCIAPVTDLHSCIAAVDYKRLPSKLRCRLAASAPFRSQRNIGTVALEWCWLAAGRFQLYLHGGQKLWDYAAGELIFREAGGIAQTLEGEELYTGRLVSRSAIAAGNRRLFQLWHESITDLLHENRL